MKNLNNHKLNLKKLKIKNHRVLKTAKQYTRARKKLEFKIKRKLEENELEIIRYKSFLTEYQSLREKFQFEEKNEDKKKFFIGGMSSDNYTNHFFQ